VHGTWNGLAEPVLDHGDLPASNDYRAVLAELLEQRCGVPAAAAFPGLGSGRLGLARPR
jgi:uncharacterized protein (DUF1501 family)